MDNLTISEQKKLLRKQFIEKRLQLTPSQWQIKSDHLCQNLVNSEIFNQAKVILSYLSFKQEPDLSLLHQQQSFICGLPRCQGKSLMWHQWQWGDKLRPNSYGIYEPLPNYPLIDITTVDLILVPAVMCDRNGYRLGYGGGYYDRMLELPSWQNIPTIGIVFNFAYVPQLPYESWDKPLNYICTESTMIEKVKN
ncbi:5-formyltetrahydrofolate cyclo-ligase [Geminocystis sp. GBBB08]|uniref:5-formyltetrahydrofolate cyclo-ligase n=1 Tax=Geminocystis sp. GBBB08 TaxID=2604140 RepID=UPI0027E2B774|nr:5-formyltetrahydrofolate cyclo-ligase [Geminocystis sp. GBBB08]MBL1209073.1 5-formyltetrahydrofolate cyclo-ligase [Geminocystis sp. GBBB08]